MKPLPHVCRARLTGGAEGFAVVTAIGVGEPRTAPPADFDGPGDAWRTISDGRGRDAFAFHVPRGGESFQT